MAEELTRLERLRLLILGDKANEEIDDTLNLLILSSEARFNQLLAKYSQDSEKSIADAAKQFEWILDEIVIRRYNRIGSEGLSAETVDGHSVTFAEADDFAEFEPIIADYFGKEIKGRERPGKVVFY